MTVITAGASRVIVAPRGPIGPQGDAGERPVYPTWAALALVSGTAGASAEVPTSDAGTHTDPVVGGTVNNSGIFSWSSSPAGWQRVADTDAVSAANFANAAASSASSAANSASAVPLTRAADGQVANNVLTQTLGVTTFDTATITATDFYAPLGTTTKDGWLSSITARLAGSTTVKIFVLGPLSRVLTERTIAMTGSGVVTQAVTDVWVPSGSQVFIGYVSGAGWRFQTGTGTNSNRITSAAYTGVGTTITPGTNSNNISLSYTIAYVPDTLGLTQTIGILTPATPSTVATVWYSPVTPVDEDCYLQTVALRALATGDFRLMVRDRHGIVLWVQTFTASATGLQTFSISDVFIPAGGALWFNAVTVTYAINGAGTMRKLNTGDFSGNVGDLVGEQPINTGIVLAFAYTVSHVRSGSLEKRIEAAAYERSQLRRRALPAVAEERVVDASATVQALTVTTNITLSQSGLETVLTDTRTFPAATGERYDLLGYDSAAAAFVVISGTDRTAAKDAAEFIPTTTSPSQIPLYVVRCDTANAKLTSVWSMFHGEDRRLALPLAEMRHRSRSGIRRVINLIRRGTPFSYVAFGDSITAQQNAGPSSTSPNGSARDRTTSTGGYLASGGRIQADLLATIPGNFTSVQMGMADDGAGAVHSKFGMHWEAIAALQAAAGYSLGAGGISYYNFGVGGNASAQAWSAGAPTAWLSAAVALHGDLVVIELGQNELGVTTTEANIVSIIQQFQNDTLAGGGNGSAVIVLGSPRPRSEASYENWHYTQRALERAARFTGAAFVSMLPLYDQQHIGAIGLNYVDCCTCNANNHPGILEHKAIGREIAKLLLDS